MRTQGKQAMVRKILVSSLMAIAASCSSAAAAFDWISDVNVAAIEATYAPLTIRFFLTSNVGTCPGGQGFGSMVDYKAGGNTSDERIANSQMVASIIMTAKVTGRRIRVFG